MFSSNHILEVSGCLSHEGDLLNALEFALKSSDNLKNFTRRDNPVKCVYQITDDGRFCVGWEFHEIKDGWTPFPIGFNLNAIAKVIEAYMEEQKIEENITVRSEAGGSYIKGFVMRAIPESTDDEYDGIKSPSNGIVEFKPYNCFYSK